MVQWGHLLIDGWRAFKGRPYGVITCFPQLAMIAGLIKMLTFRDTRIVAYNFNLGGFPGGFRRYLARLSAKNIDVFVVHSPSEILSYANYLGVNNERIKFIPLQRGELAIERHEDTNSPFIISMGSAHRDYRTLIDALNKMKIRTVIVTRKDIVDNLPKSEFLEFHYGLSENECIKLLASARISIVPVCNLTTASGQITIVNSMRLGVPLIATRCPGTEGYIEDGVTGVLVEPFNSTVMEQAIRSLWQNSQKREKIAKHGKIYAYDNFSDEAAARALWNILSEFV